MPKRILLVETDDFYVKIIETFIKLFLQQQFIAVRDARTAMGAVGEERPDLVIVDLDDDSEGALSFAEWLRDDARTKRVPVVAISHCTKLGDEALGRGCSAFLAKPFKIREFEKRVLELEKKGGEK